MRALATLAVVCLLAGPALADKSVTGGSVAVGGSSTDTSVVALGLGDTLTATGLEDVRATFEMAVKVGDTATAKKMVELGAEMAEARNTRLRRWVVWGLGWLPLIGPLI